MTASLALRRLVGHRFDTRFTWGGIAWHPRYWKLALQLILADTDDDNPRHMLNISFLIVGLYIYLPTGAKQCAHRRMGNYEPHYGFYTIANCIVWRWATGYWSFDWPLVSFNHYSTEILTLGLEPAYIEYSKDRRGIDGQQARDDAQKRHSATAKYTYFLKSGQFQDRLATYYVERRTWTRKWVPFLKLVKTSIWVTFNEEIGESTGSWKGGTTGCGYDLKRGETPYRCLLRMEAERTFD